MTAQFAAEATLVITWYIGIAVSTMKKTNYEKLSAYTTLLIKHMIQQDTTILVHKPTPQNFRWTMLQNQN
jgi:hypothetical protein